MGSPSPVEAYLADLAPSGVPAMRSALTQIARAIDPRWPPDRDLSAFPWHTIRRPQTQAIRAALARRYRPRSANRMLSALRQVLRRCWQDGRIPRDDYLLAVDIKPIPIVDPSPGRALDPHEIEAIAAAARAPGGLTGLRDAALVALLYGAGVRRIEAARARTTDYTYGTHEIRVLGKGSTYRTVPIIPGWEPDLERWIAQLPPGPLFPRFRRGAPTRASTTADDIGVIVEAIRTRSGVSFTAHDFRRSFATHLIDNGVDLGLVKMLMGHRQIQTTTIYDRRGEAAKREAVRVLARGR